MKNFFDWDYIDNSFEDKDDKCLPNTDHATGNAYEHIYDSFNPHDNRHLLHEKEQRMIDNQDENRYFSNLDNEVEDLDFLSEEEEQQLKPKPPTIQKEEDINSDKIAKNTVSETKLASAVAPSSKQTINEGSNDLQKSVDYKLSKKWKQKMKSVLEQKRIHQFSAKHNRNMAKFFIRLFSKYLKMSPQMQEFSAEIHLKLQEIMEKNCVSLNDLQSLFRCEGSDASREFMCKILRTKLKQEIIKSQDVQNKAAYLLCSKVYALRCRSRHLIGRLQSR